MVGRTRTAPSLVILSVLAKDLRQSSIDARSLASTLRMTALFLFGFSHML